MNDLFSIKDASAWATEHLGKAVSTANISYLVQYGRIKKFGESGQTLISQNELNLYYNSYNCKRENSFKEKLGDDLNWALSFDEYTEAETTKHVHRLHPYKGKFIPQLVEYFLDSHKDEFKKEVYFKKGDIVLDPFSGSGTTMVQASELGIHAVGLDISAFNSKIGNSKVTDYNLLNVEIELQNLTKALKDFLLISNTEEFEASLMKELYEFNQKYFPVPEYKYKVQRHEINEDVYGYEKENEFLAIYKKLIKKYNILLRQDKSDNFLDKWYSEHIRNEIDFVFKEINKIKNIDTKNIISVTLSRTIRSCRATTHADLATLKEPMTTSYYCGKHGYAEIWRN